MTEESKSSTIRLGSRIRLGAVAAFLSRGTAIVAQVVVVPLAIELVGRELYGAFLVLTSLLGWLSISNLGLAAGMTTSLAAAVADERDQDARKIIASTLALIGLVSLGIAMTLPLVPFVSWNGFLGVAGFDGNPFANSVAVGVALTALGLFVSSGDRVLQAQQRIHVSHFLNVGSSLLVIALLLLLRNTSASLAILTACLLGPRVMAQFVGLSVALRPRRFRPSPRDVDRKVGTAVFRTGMGFFLAQLASIAMWQTDNVVVGQLFGAETVAAYATTFRLSVVVTMLVYAALTGVWAAVAASIATGDVQQIDRWRRKTIVMVLAFSGTASAAVFLLGDITIRTWTNGELAPPPGMLVPLAIHIPLFSFCIVQGVFLNGLGRVRGQAIYGTAAALLNILLSLALGKSFGPQGVCWATVISGLLPAFLTWRELRMALQDRSKEQTTKIKP